MTESKRRAWRLGQSAEAAAVALLRLKGYRILGRDLRFAVGELDIVAHRGDWLVFVEVKARTADARVEAISFRQRTRIARAAEAFLASRPALAPSKIRFDVILIEPARWPKHLIDAWRPGD